MQSPGGTTLSELRRTHGWDKPHDVKFWCLGNEMDGPWQMEAKTADGVRPHRRGGGQDDEVGRPLDRTGRLRLVGPAHADVRRLGSRPCCEHTFDHVEYISLHTYLNNYDQDTPAFLASFDLMDNFIDEVVAIADAVAAKRRSSKRIMLCFDEWNVWYRTRRNRRCACQPGWPVAPPILEEIYNMEDALAFGGCCISLLNHADRVTAACLAQLVNVIAPIMTETGGPAWRQTIFHPFAHFSRMGRGRVLRTQINSPTYAARYNDPNGPLDEFFPLPAVPYLKLAAVHDDKTGTLTLFALNRSLTEEMPLELLAGGFKGLSSSRRCSSATPTSRRSTARTSPTASRPSRWPRCGRRARS